MYQWNVSAAGTLVAFLLGQGPGTAGEPTSASYETTFSTGR